MKCPYCNNEMVKGMLPQDRYAVRWVPEEGGLFKRFKERITLSSFWEDKECTAYLCRECKKIIIDLNE